MHRRVVGLRFDHLSVQSEKGPIPSAVEGPAIRLLDVKDLTFTDLKIPDGADPAFQIAGGGTRAVHVRVSDLSRAKVKVSASDGGNENAVEFEP